MGPVLNATVTLAPHYIPHLKLVDPVTNPWTVSLKGCFPQLVLRLQVDNACLIGAVCTEAPYSNTLITYPDPRREPRLRCDANCQRQLPPFLFFG